MESAVSARRPPVALLYAITVTGVLSNTLVTPAIPDILRGLDAPASAAGLLVAAATLPGVLLAPVIGVLADRYGRREVLVPCTALFAVAGGLGALAPDIGVLIALRFLQGAGSAGLINLVVVVIGDHWPDEERADLIGRNSAVLTASLAVFPVLGGVLTDIGTWRAPFLVYPVGLVTAWVTYRTMAPGGGGRVRLREQLARAGPVLRSRHVLLVYAAAFVLFAIIFGLILTVLPIYAESTFGLGAGWRGVLLGLPAVGSSAVAANLGRLRRRFPARLLIATAGAAFAVALVAMALAPAVGVLLVAAVLFGVGEGATIPSLQDLAAAAGTDASRGTVVATFVSAARGGQTVGPVVASGGLEAGGARAVYLVGAVVALVLFTPLGFAAADTAG